MKEHAVVGISGKQYIVKKGDEIIVDCVKFEPEAEFEIPVLLEFDGETGEYELGKETSKAKVKVLSHMKGDKIRIAKFKSKVRYRRVQGFRASLSKVQIVGL